MIYDFYDFYDFYACFQFKNKQHVDDLISGSGKYKEVSDVLSRIMILNTIFNKTVLKEKFPDEKNRPKIAPLVYAISRLKDIIHSKGNHNKKYIDFGPSKLKSLGIDISPDISALPVGSGIIEIPITLKKPFISKDDIPLYIIENPIRKDKVFGIPFTSAMSWKGNLRWTMMKVFLEPVSDKPEEFAQTRFRHTLLFGTEKGWGEVKGWTEYLDNLCDAAKEKCKEKYINLIKERFKTKEAKDVHLQGSLHFYPTFWDRIDMMVINPHDRETKTGKNPIYFEVVPAGAKGTFRLVYVPVYWIGLPDDEFKKKIIEDLESVIKGLKETMLTYGFSAKKSSGFGVIEDKWDSSASRLEIKGFGEIQKFGNFEDLERVVDKGRV